MLRSSIPKMEPPQRDTSFMDMVYFFCCITVLLMVETGDMDWIPRRMAEAEAVAVAVRPMRG